MEEQILRLRKDGLTYDEIKEITKYKLTDISKICRQNGIDRYDNSIQLDSDTIKILQKDYDDGLSLRNVAKKNNISYHTIRKYIKSKVKVKKSDDELRTQKSKSVIDWRIRKKQELVEYKGGGCIICRYKKSLRSLQFHHINPLEKDFTISGKSYSINRLKEEVDKCILVCSNCHCEIHDGLYTQYEIDKFYLLNNKRTINITNENKTNNKTCNCGNIKDKHANMCIKCYKQNNRKVKRPPYDQLLKEIEDTNYCAVGRKYGVSDNAIRKWKKEYEKNMDS